MIERYLPGFGINIFSELNCKWVNQRMYRLYNSLWEWKLLSHIQLFVTPWTVDKQVPLSMEFSRPEYWSGQPFPSPGNLPNPGIKPRTTALQSDSLPSEPPVEVYFLFNPSPLPPEHWGILFYVLEYPEWKKGYHFIVSVHFIDYDAQFLIHSIYNCCMLLVIALSPDVNLVDIIITCTLWVRKRKSV